VTVFPPGQAITLFGMEIVNGGFVNHPSPLPRLGSLGPTLSQTASGAFPGPDASALALVNIDQMGNFLFTVIDQGIASGPFNLGRTPLG